MLQEKAFINKEALKDKDGFHKTYHACPNVHHVFVILYLVAKAHLHQRMANRL